ncbi:MAG: hypothetical protein AMJ92_02810 [candidate division Zixibacteria bacterium SM23_81]|nr:MAG: hypothetical protein AMJ92_02810 [candidate division Zixibacteria bacterium SM23_81]
MIQSNSALKIAIYLGSYLLAAAGVHFVVTLILRQYRLPDGGLKRAGALIGILERTFVLTLVLIGEYSSIALIFTAKSIARFEELKDRKFAEYYLIGTLTSILCAMLIGILTRRLLDGM